MPENQNNIVDTIVAAATPLGVGAVAMIRVSGPNAIAVVSGMIPKKKLEDQAGHTLHVGTLHDGERPLDEVVISLYRSPKSYTGEDVVEITTHGSPFIVKEVMEALIRRGVRPAEAGEFSQRAFLNGRMDLTRIEAVADLIAAETETARRTALTQLKGGFSNTIKALREELIGLAALLELELDFSEEDVEFADRSKLKQVLQDIRKTVAELLQSYRLGQVVKNGVPTVIAGKPNAGKSTLLNALLNEEKAIVSPIPGTTRDYIEDELVIDGLQFRFTDTAGLRDTSDQIEALGVQRTKEKMTQASLLIYLFDVESTNERELIQQIEEIKNYQVPFLVVGNKAEGYTQEDLKERYRNLDGLLFISAKQKKGLEDLKRKILESVQAEQISSTNMLVTNSRHYHGLFQSQEAIQLTMEGLEQGLSSDLVAGHLRQALQHLGELTGAVSSEDVLGAIFSKFCIGK